MQQAKNEKLEKVNSYPTPYHWFIERETTKGRLYFGYLDWCKQHAEGKMLDLGCGDGRFIAMLEGDVRGIDNDERGIAFAKLLNPAGVYEVVDGKQVPYADKTFDRVFLIETLEHIPPPEIDGLMKEIYRVLKDDGTCIITVPSIRMENKPDSKHYQHFSVDSLRQSVAPYFTAEVVGQSRAGFHPFKILYKLLDNPIWLIRPLARWYNLRVWPRIFNVCKAEQGNRLMAVCTKSGL